MSQSIKKLAGSALTAAVLSGAPALAGTLEEVIERGHLECGVSTGSSPGFAFLNENNVVEGIDADTCRIVASAIFGDPGKVVFSPLENKERFTALQAGEIDMLARTTTWTLSRDVGLAFDFAAVNYYDGQGFIVRADLGVSSAKELDGATVCTTSGTTSELNLRDFFSANGMTFSPVVYEKSAETRTSFFAGRCDAFSSDASWIAGLRLQAENPDDYVVLPDIISKEPLGIVVRHGDNVWKDAVAWAFYAAVEAEELGITSENVDEILANNTNPAVARFLGAEGNLGEQLGLPADYAYQVIKNVGNYGEMFERTVGKDSPLNLERGMNALWTDGGMQYAPPAR
ncbi:amino acid ABC transporter substrate-binding protein [Roseovarius sp. 2305UL8-3]|uniref:amino acid ABC transporter substrate-binding protein n=1 Tax=Roseovarius conchicola TaxID=3121636 RepID=UPI003528A05D